MHRHGVSDTLGRVCDKLGSVTVDHLRVSLLWVVGVGLGEGDIEDGGPLLDLLSQVGILDDGVGGAVESCEAGICAVVARIHAVHHVGPLLAGVDDLTSGALRVRAERAGARGASKAAGWDTGVAGGSGEDIGVGGGEDVGHHAAGGGAGDKDLLWVGVVFVDGVLDHVDEAIAVTAAAMSERCLGINVPAVAVLRGGRVDSDESMFFGE